MLTGTFFPHLVLRRIYFLLPDAASAWKAAVLLMRSGVARSDLHALARAGVDMGELPVASPHQREDLFHRLERLGWRGNMLLFFAAAVGLLASWAVGAWAMVMLFGLITTTCFALGVWNAVTPDTSLDEFHAAIAHGEVLLMVDVPRKRIADVEHLIHATHPEAVDGGGGWLIGARGL